MIGIMSAFGAGMGVGMDALVIRTRVIYRNRGGLSSSHFRIAPLIGTGRKSIALLVSF